MVEFCPEHMKWAGELGEIHAEIKGTREDVKRLDTRINGALDKFAAHVADSPKWHTRIELLEQSCKMIAQEKLNTTKAAQWRIGLIVALIPTIVAVLLHFLK